MPATLEQLETALKNADAAGDVDAARKLAGVISRARRDPVYQIPGTQVEETIEKPPEPTLEEQAIGAGEAALTLGTAATGGTVGMIGGFLKGVAEQLRAGEFGTREAADLIEQEAMKGAQALTYEPRTETGQEMVTDVGEVLSEALPPVIPVAGAPGAVAAGAGMARRAVSPAVSAVSEIAEGAFKYQSPTKQRIAKLIEEGSTDVETAKFKLEGKPGEPSSSKLGRFLNVGGPKVKTDKRAVEAIRQGFDDGVIAAIKGASESDRTKMKQMVNIMELGKKNKLFAAKNRPSDVAGNTLMSRFTAIRDANRDAGKSIDKIANTLKGKNIDISEASSSFANKLDELGVKLLPDGKGGFKPDFELSVLPSGDRGPIKEVIRQMNIRGAGGVDALSVHKMKRIIDNNVTFGKVKTGISGDAERALKSFRVGLDKVLDDNFKAYNAANVKYAETINVLNDFQDIAGKKMDLSGGNADKAVGTLLRRLMSNAQSRVRLLDSVDEIESIARKHGGSTLKRIEGKTQGKDDLLMQVLFVDELDAVFGPVARTSLQGQMDQALKQGVSAATSKAGAVDVGLGVIGKAAEKVRGLDEAGAFKAIKELLRDAQ